MQKENKVIVKLNCFPARSLCGVSRFFVSDRRSSVRSKIGRCRITTFRQNTDFNVGLTPDLHVKQRGFTLIELLVVVLIIGILAAVALPQYQRAIDKSRFMTYIQVLHGIKRAQETYYLANGFYAPDLKELDVDYTAGCTSANGGTNLWTCPHGFFIDLGLGNNVALGAVSVSLCPGHNTSYESCRDNKHAFYHIYFDHYSDATKSGKTKCSSSTTRGEAICKSLQNM